MTTSPTDDQTTPATEPMPASPWYSLNPKHIRFSKFTWWFLAVASVVLLLNFVSIKPLWQWGWRTRIYCFTQFYPVRSDKGIAYPGGAWLRSKTIHVYCAPDADPALAETCAQGLRGLVEELGLDIDVQAIPLSPEAKRSLEASLVKRGDGSMTFDTDRFDKLRLDDRGDDYGEMVVIGSMDFRDPDWAWGLTDFASGIAVLREEVTTIDLARHEGAHLLGYDKHDDMPAYILGYREDWNPQARNTLMMLLPKTDSALSDRARDALLAFYRGQETRTGQRFFRGK